MHVKMGLQPREIQALIDANDRPDGSSGIREALDAAGGKLLDEKTIRNVARQWRWPADKFNMRQDDLFRDLNSRYITFPFSIQEMGAFHRDVCDVAKEAGNAEQLHKMLNERRARRLQELDDGFDRAAVHIHSVPRHGDHQHWEHALRLFRDRSYDSLVKYLSARINQPDPAQGQERPGVGGCF